MTEQPTTLSVAEARRLALDDELSTHPRGQIVVIGCGNILRGDEAVGPTLIRHLWVEGDIPEAVTLVDGGTGGMDVAFKMRGAKAVILIDASDTGVKPGTIYRIPGEEVEQLPPLQGLHSHNFRWDHALAFAHWLLGDEYPDDITVYLIEAAQLTPGADLSEPVDAAMRQVGDMVRAHWSESDSAIRSESDSAIKSESDSAIKSESDIAEQLDKAGEQS